MKNFKIIWPLPNKNYSLFKFDKDENYHMEIKNLNLLILVLVVTVGISAYTLFKYFEPGPILHDCFIACPDGTSVECSQKCPSIIVKNSGGSAMLIAECANKSYLYDNADVILIGTVYKNELMGETCTTDENGNEICTVYTSMNTTISIEKFEKGNLNSNTLMIETTSMEDEPIFYENKTVRIYLQQTGNEFSIVCGIAGVEEVQLMPEREVGQDITVTGVVKQVNRKMYSIDVTLEVTGGGGTSSNQNISVGDSILVTFSGIGPVNNWKSYSLKNGDIISLKMHFAENSYWEAFDEGLSQ